MSLPTLDGYRVQRLSGADAARLQVLYERCSDYHQQHEGIPTRPSAAAEELAAVPPGTPADDKFPLGICTPGGELAAYLDLVRDCPSAGEWQLGLLMVDPALRNAGLGRQVYRAAADWMARMGARTVTLGVLEHSPAAERFWRRLGFDEVRRQRYTSETGRTESRLIVMRHTLASRPDGGITD